MTPPPAAPRTVGALPRRRGLSLVELMVGIVVGLFVVAAAAMLVSGQLAENRRLLLDTQLQQDLRATADIVTRELRRTGAWGKSWNGVWSAGTPAQDNALNHVSPSPAAPASAVTTSDITFGYERSVFQSGDWRFLKQGDLIRTKVDPGPNVPMQDLTDPNTMVVDTFDVTVEELGRVRIPCPKPCPGGGVGCWPEQVVRDFVVDITAHARSDPSVTRSIRSRVRQRNDAVVFNVLPGPQACPD